MGIINHNYALLLSGGSGTRFWPLSRIRLPKQFLPLYEQKSLFDQTIKRIKSLFPSENIFIATHQIYRKKTIETIKPYRIPIKNIICEPSSKNTAPSIGIGIRLISLKDPQARVCVLPCDHLIQHPSVFISFLKKALLRCNERLVVFGIVPERPATGYGYIKAKGKSEKSKRITILEVERFLEKPDLERAKKLIKDKRYFWNSGMFVGSSEVFLNEIKKHLPRMYQLVCVVKNQADINRIWKHITPVSFDYGVLEKSSNLSMMPAEGFGWSDLGSWLAYEELLTKDHLGNYCQQNVVAVESRNVTVVGEKKRIALIGVEDLIIVNTPDALLITKKDKTEKVKLVVEALKQRKANEL